MKENFKFREVNFTPSTNRVILKCDKFATFKQSQRILDEEGNKGKDPMKDEMSTIISKVDVKFSYQVMEVAALPVDYSNRSAEDKYNNAEYKVGDKVLVDFRAVKKFDLYKDLYWVWTMDIVGKVKA